MLMLSILHVVFIYILLFIFFNQGGRGHWTVNFISLLKEQNNTILFMYVLVEIEKKFPYIKYKTGGGGVVNPSPSPSYTSGEGGTQESSAEDYSLLKNK